MSAQILVQASGLVREYREGKIVTPVLRGVNLHVYENEMVSIIGSSGSGKSTLLHILGTLDRPGSGELLFKGQNLLKLHGQAIARFRNENLGFVYQFHHLLSDFTALENAAMPLFIRGVKRKEAFARAEVLLERVGLAHRMKHKPSELSGGERQRVAIARAIVGKPSLVLADEPTGNLDHSSAESIFELLSELKQETGCSLVVVTHDRDLASRFERQIEMRDGVVME